MDKFARVEKCFWSDGSQRDVCKIMIGEFLLKYCDLEKFGHDEVLVINAAAEAFAQEKVKSAIQSIHEETVATVKYETDRAVKAAMERAAKTVMDYPVGFVQTRREIAAAIRRICEK